ncbi:MAG TPA: tRNA (adenosine(37)-N6)-dimethylallyltransferase MiaA [Steroidobacteraceae bacterium]|jgi:tRNA dimethylallyltransferase
MAAIALPLVVALTGPTGSGKSACALALVERLGPRMPVEIVSVDSAQVYRGMDIGTAKPDRATRARVPHHLIDIRDPAQSFSAGDFVRAADEVIAAVHARGALPLLVGGTMLYLRALREGLAAMPRGDVGIRAEIEALAARGGWSAVHDELARVDPEAAARIAPQDSQRLQRALEVFRITDCPISRWHAQARAARPAYRWLNFSLWPESRQALRLHLQLRFEAMLRAGLVEEVRGFYQRGDLTARHSSMRAVGYRQLWRYCAGELTLEQAVTQAVRDTIQLAKRQLTWLRRERHFSAVNDLSVGALEALAERISATAGA